jgi:hypothetical protein
MRRGIGKPISYAILLSSLSHVNWRQAEKARQTFKTASRRTLESVSMATFCALGITRRIGSIEPAGALELTVVHKTVAKPL